MTDKLQFHQLDNIREEFKEAMEAEGLGEQIAELTDLEQSIQTFFYMCAEKYGINIDAFRIATIAKTRARGYESNA